MRLATELEEVRAAAVARLREAVAGGLGVRRAAAQAGVSERTAWRWVRQWRRVRR